MEWLGLLATLIGEAVKQIQAGIAASKEEQEQLEARSKEALEVLRGTRSTVNVNMDARERRLFEAIKRAIAEEELTTKIKGMVIDANKLE